MLIPTTPALPAFTAASMPLSFTPAMTMAAFTPPPHSYINGPHHGMGSKPEPDEPNFKPPYWACATAALLLTTSGCKYLNKKKSRGTREGVGEQKDAHVKRNIPAKAFMIGKSFPIATPKSGGIPTMTEHRMKLEAKKSALARVRSYFKRKKPVRCLSEIKIEFRSEIEEYELHVGKRGRHSFNYYTYKLPWTQASCIGKGRMAGGTSNHLFMVENPHRTLFDQ